MKNLKKLINFFGPLGLVAFLVLSIFVISGNTIKIVPGKSHGFMESDFLYFIRAPYVGGGQYGMVEFITYTDDFEVVANKVFDAGQIDSLEDPNNWRLIWVGPSLDIVEKRVGKPDPEKEKPAPKARTLMPWEVVSSK